MNSCSLTIWFVDAFLVLHVRHTTGPALGVISPTTDARCTAREQARACCNKGWFLQEEGCSRYLNHLSWGIKPAQEISSKWIQREEVLTQL